MEPMPSIPVALEPLSLKDTPALIEHVFPATKVSFEAQRERKAGAKQTLTGLGSYWKGRKPLILVRAIVLGSLLPPTDDTEQDLALFEALLGIDMDGLARRAVSQNALAPDALAKKVALDNPWAYFKPVLKAAASISESDLRQKAFPLDTDALGISLRWKPGVTDDSKAFVLAKAMDTFPTYEARTSVCKRPEEVDEAWLYAPVWPKVNAHYAHLGVRAHSFGELVEQLGILRYGHRPRVGDTFAGGGSIPFEAARLGCDAFASDLNPVACMLNWGNSNIIGAADDEQARQKATQEAITKAVDKEMTALGVEHDANGNRAKMFLYCLETRCPETGWRVPMLPSLVISKKRKVIARLIPNHEKKRFDIAVDTGVSQKAMTLAEKGTVRKGYLVYELNGQTVQVAIKTLRGDYLDSEGRHRNQLRLWEKTDFMPREDDIFQERLYAIQWYAKETLATKQPKTFFAAVTDEDQVREQQVASLVARHLEQWQAEGVVPDMPIEHGAKTDEPIRTRGWTHWHHLFNPRHLLLNATVAKHAKTTPEMSVMLAALLNRSSSLCHWNSGRDTGECVFYNQALNTFFNYATRGSLSALNVFSLPACRPVGGTIQVMAKAAADVDQVCDLWINDPPYADAVSYEQVTEFFIAWLRKNPPAPFDQWVWDSRRHLAIKGADDDFRRGMVDAYKAMADHMPDNGRQCVMFTHQDSGIWSDMVGIFWAAGLQVVSAWYIATETTSELKKGGYVQGTVILLLRKRPEGERKGFTRRLYPAIRSEVQRQVEEMLHLNQRLEDHTGEPVFNDADLQMAGYAAALKVLTSYTEIGGEDVTNVAMRPRQKGDVTDIDRIVQEASKTANSLLVPDGLDRQTWEAISGIQRFYVRMMDIEGTGASKLDNYQNFAKAFNVQDFTRVMASTSPNQARLKQVEEMTSRDLMDTTELGATLLGRLMGALQQLLSDVDIQAVTEKLETEVPDYFSHRSVMADMAYFLAAKASHLDVRYWAEALGDRITNGSIA